jgi:cell division protein FtsB
MNARQGILLFAGVFTVVALFFFVIFNDQGLLDLGQLRKERDHIREQNRQLARENLSLSVEIDRLHSDPEYIESIARREFGMIRKEEVVVKPQRPPGGDR